MSALFEWLAEGLKYLMIFCDRIAGHNYWLSLLLFALIIKLLLFPLGIKQQRNQQKLALLRPKEEAIKRKYKTDNISDVLWEKIEALTPGQRGQWDSAR